jgi:4'-phosphopantetheinyl transferase
MEQSPLNDTSGLQRPWLEGPQHPPMPLTGAHVWMANINPAGPLSVEGLSTDEVRHAQAARSESFRSEFVRTRQILRELLGRYLQAPPASIRFQKNEYGKPSIVRPAGHELKFNLSHSAGTALFAFAWGREIGIDIDRMDRVTNWQAVAKRVFSEPDQRALATMPEAGGQAAFMRGWVRKEAYTKARGMGFKYGFSRVSVSLDTHGKGSLLISDEQDPSAPSTWVLRDLPLVAPAAAALAFETGVSDVRCWQIGPLRVT